METDFLRSFHAVATSGSFTEAARQLNRSQSTVSGHVGLLEDLLGVRLFVRTTRSCRMTQNGRQLMDYALRVLEAVDQMHDAFRPSLLGGKVKVGVPDDSYLFPLLTKGLKTFMKKRPDVNIEITAGLAENLRSELSDGLLDLAFVRDVASGDDQICLSRLCWVASPDFRVRPDDILPLAHISRPCSYFREASSALTKAGIRWKSAVSCTSLPAVLAVVRSGLAVAAVLEDEHLEPDLLSHRLELPELPLFGLTYLYSNEEPTVLSRLIVREIWRQLDPIASNSSIQGTVE